MATVRPAKILAQYCLLFPYLLAYISWSVFLTCSKGKVVDSAMATNNVSMYINTSKKDIIFCQPEKSPRYITADAAISSAALFQYSTSFLLYIPLLESISILFRNC